MVPSLIYLDMCLAFYLYVYFVLVHGIVLQERVIGGPIPNDKGGGSCSSLWGLQIGAHWVLFIILIIFYQMLSVF